MIIECISIIDGSQRRSDRSVKRNRKKMQYQEYDLKAEKTIIDQEEEQIKTIPSREDSYERLLELDIQFLDDIRRI